MREWGVARATNMALYRVLRDLGAEDARAEEAAQLDVSDLATKADLAALRTELKADMSSLKADLVKWGVGLLFTGLAMQTGLIIFVLARTMK